MTSPPWNLTEREREAVALLFDLDSDKMIAKRLGVSHRAVEALLRQARERMGAQSRLQAAVMWDRWERARGSAA